MMLLWVVVLILLVGLVWAMGQRGGWFGSANQTVDRAEATLRDRFARGEIDEATYQRMREELRR
jgi:putative membrane protein